MGSWAQGKCVGLRGNRKGLRLCDSKKAGKDGWIGTEV